jgi:hypothetical protein
MDVCSERDRAFSQDTEKIEHTYLLSNLSQTQ